MDIESFISSVPAPAPEFYTSLSKAQAQFEVPVKNKKVKYEGVEFWYADLSSCFEATRKGLAENGFSVTHRTQIHGGGNYLIAELGHAHGKIISVYPLPNPAGGKPQNYGSALTYGRRYTFTALAGIAAEEDLDGLGAGAAAKIAQPPKPKPKPHNHAPGAKNDPVEPQSFPPDDPPEPSIQEINTMVKKYATLNVSMRQICKKYSLDNINDLTVDMISDLTSIGQEIKNGRALVAEMFPADV